MSKHFAVIAALMAFTAAPLLGSDAHHSLHNRDRPISCAHTEGEGCGTKRTPARGRFSITRTPCTPGITPTSRGSRRTAA